MNLTLNLTVEETEFILRAISKMPYEDAAVVFMKIKSEAQKQVDTYNKQMQAPPNVQPIANEMDAIVV
jgi:hypothetical protein